MQKKEIKFLKYKLRHADYHYREINPWHLLKFNLFLYTRYTLVVSEIEKYLQGTHVRHRKIRVLDIGCGDGVLLYLLQKKIKTDTVEMHGIDLSLEALHIAQEKIPGCKFSVKDVYHTGYPDHYFDIIISSDVIEHLQNPRQMLREITRVANKNAFVLIGTPIRFTENPAKFHVHEFFPSELQELFREYFQKTRLVRSHPLYWYLFYTMIIKIGKLSLAPGQYLINTLFLLFRINPFMQRRHQIEGKFSYMYVSGFNK